MIYSIVLFEDAKSPHAVTSPRRSISKLHTRTDTLQILNSGGTPVCVFDLFELINKQYPVNDISYKLLDKLLPVHFDLINNQNLDAEQKYL